MTNESAWFGLRRQSKVYYCLLRTQVGLRLRRPQNLAFPEYKGCEASISNSAVAVVGSLLALLLQLYYMAVLVQYSVQHWLESVLRSIKQRIISSEQPLQCCYCQHTFAAEVWQCAAACALPHIGFKCRKTRQSTSFRFRLPVLHIQNLSNHCRHKYDSSISRIF